MLREICRVLIAGEPGLDPETDELIWTAGARRAAELAATIALLVLLSAILLPAIGAFIGLEP